MQLSYKTRRLLVISAGIIILTLASNEGAKEIGSSTKPLRQGIPYPHIPLDIDPRALDLEPVQASAPAPSVPPPPLIPRSPVSAEAYLVANLDSGEIYVEADSRHVFPIASISKLITSIIAIHHMNSGQKVTMTEEMLKAYGDAGKLVAGETYTIEELLYPLLLESSNDAAEAIAQAYNYPSFIEKMNAFVRELGMTSTAFKDASGLNPGNVSSARDLLILARYIYANEKKLLEISRQPSYSVASTTDHMAHTWKSINPFPYDPHFMGGKTGRTMEAKESMMSLFRYNQGGYSYPVAVIVLRSDFSVREEDSSYLFSQFVKKLEKSL